MSQLWEVVGGAEKGGILVRTGKELKSAEAASRLSTGALVKEVELVGDRLRYEKVDGSGPDSGWVSITLRDKILVKKTDKQPPSREQAPDAANAEQKPRRSLPTQTLSPDETVDWINSAVDEFEALLLPLELQENDAIIKKQFRQLSLLVHPDKNPHPEAATAFQKLFTAMQNLSDPLEQRMAFRRAKHRSGTSVVEESWWDVKERGGSVDEMMKAFQEAEKLQEKLGVAEAQNKFDNARLGKKTGGEVDVEKLWISSEDAKDLLDRDLVIFVDSRDTTDFAVSHIHRAHSLPGHSPEQLKNVDKTPTFNLIVDNPEQSVIVYSDNGSAMSRCSYMARALRHRVKPERVLRLTGGLNLWKRNGFPVEGDTRTLFAGKALGEGMMRLGGQS